MKALILTFFFTAIFSPLVLFAWDSNEQSSLADALLETSLNIAKSDTVDTNDEPEDRKNDIFDSPFFTNPITDFLEDNSFSRQVRRTDSLVTRTRRIDLNPQDFSGRTDLPGTNDLHPLLSIPDNSFTMRYNRVDGFYVGLNSSPFSWPNNSMMRSRVGKFYGTLGYAFGMKEWQYNIGYERFFGTRDILKIGANFHSMTFSDDLWRIGTNENSLFSLFAGYDYYDYHFRQGFNAYSVLRTTPYIEHTLRFRSEDYESLDVATTYSFFGRRSSVRANPMISEGYMQSLEWTTGFQTGGLILNNRLMFAGDIRAELGSLDFLQSDFDFNRYEAELRSIFRIDSSNMLKWRLRAGTSTAEEVRAVEDPDSIFPVFEGGLPVQRMFALGGIGSLRAREFKSLQGTQMILSNLELHLSNYRTNSTLSDQINWSQYKLYLFLDSGWVNTDDADTIDPFAGFSEFSFDQLKHDIGFGISFSSSRASVLRFELAWPAEDLKATPNFIVRFNPTF